MGAANVVPGVSGGTVALITGIYTDIVNALNSITQKDTWKSLLKGHFKEFWKKINGSFVLALGAGIVVSIFSLAKLVTVCLEAYPVLTWAFFFGLVLASVIVMIKGIKSWRLVDFVFVVLGIALGLFVTTLSPSGTAPNGLWYIFLCGAVSICAMILPGISGSFIMVLFGKYDVIMSAVTELNWSILVTFALGCVVGILAFAKLLHWLLARWEKQTMICLIGFVIGSLIKIWPWQNSLGMPVAPFSDIWMALLFCVVGFMLVIGIEIASLTRNNKV